MKHSFRTGYITLTCCIIFLLCACGAAGNSIDGQSGRYYEEMPPAPIYQMALAASYDDFTERSEVMFNTTADRNFDAELPTESLSQFIGAEEQTRKLVKRADLRLRVDDLSATEKPLTDLMEKYNAWPASTGFYENSRNYTIRVPSAYYDAMLAELASLGRILRRIENAEDVTLRYYDLESRLATRRELLRTYQSYLGRASNIEEIMTVESWISNLQREIDQTGTQFRNLTSQIDYSTIEVEIIGSVSASSYHKPTLGERLNELFSSFGDVASTVLVVLAGIIIYGVPAIFLLILLFWLLFGRIGLIKKVWRLAAGKK